MIDERKQYILECKSEHQREVAATLVMAGFRVELNSNQYLIIQGLSENRTDIN